MRISRLDALKLQIQQQLMGMDRLASSIYTQGYHRTAYELQRGIGTGWTFHQLNEDVVGKVLSRPWTVDRGLRTWKH